MPDAPGDGLAFDPSIVISSDLAADRKLNKLTGAVGYFQRVVQTWTVAVVQARLKTDRLTAQLAAAEGAVISAELSRQQAEQDLAAAEAAVAAWEG